MKWKAIYLNEVICSDESDWDAIPDWLLCVIIYRQGTIHRLLYADYYWVGDDAYGMIYDGSCCPKGSVWWENGIKMKTPAPDDIILKAGLMIPDADWKKFEEGLHAVT